MSALQQEFPSVSVRQFCNLLSVSRSWFYARPHQPTQAERDIALRDAVERIVLAFPGYGYRRVTAELHRQQWEVNHKRVLLAVEQHLRSLFGAAYKPRTELGTSCARPSPSSPPSATTSPRSGCSPSGEGNGSPVTLAVTISTRNDC